jgi:DNA-binding NarL/FixJ family response regulator
MSIRIAIVEDDSRIRESLFQLIQDAPGLFCTGAHRSAEEALEAIPRHKPDVVLMDINLPQLSGIECVRMLKTQMPELQIIMHTVYDNSAEIFQSLEAGASGYLLKRTPPKELLAAIQEIHRGGAPMSSYIARKVIQTFQQKDTSTAARSILSPREHEILAFVAKGYINKEIADALGVGLETIRSHLKNIYEKLHVRSRTEAVVKYYKP